MRNDTSAPRQGIFCSLSQRAQLISTWYDRLNNNSRQRSTKHAKRVPKIQIIYNTGNGSVLLLHCQIFKVGTQAYRRYFQTLSINGTLLRYWNKPGPFLKFHPEKNASRFEYGQFCEKPDVPVARVKQAFSGHKKMFMVRHPLQRLVSAYFELRRDGWKKRLPTFSAFVGLIRRGTKNKHYKSFMESCMPCSLSYDYPLKMENLESELREANREIGIDSRVQVPRFHVNSAMSSSSSSAKYDTLLRQFEASQPDQFQWLLDAYSSDMHMFGYTWKNHSSSVFMKKPDVVKRTDVFHTILTTRYIISINVTAIT